MRQACCRSFYCAIVRVCHRASVPSCHRAIVRTIVRACVRAVGPAVGALKRGRYVFVCREGGHEGGQERGHEGGRSGGRSGGTEVKDLCTAGTCGRGHRHALQQCRKQQRQARRGCVAGVPHGRPEVGSVGAPLLGSARLVGAQACDPDIVPRRGQQRGRGKRARHERPRRPVGAHNMHGSRGAVRVARALPGPGLSAATRRARRTLICLCIHDKTKLKAFSINK